MQEMELKALVVDDEQLNNQHLCKLLGEYCPELTVVGAARSVDEALVLIGQHKPELIFLDIQMPHKNGFDLLKNLPDLDSMEVIFVTAHDEFGIQAIKFSALDYLLKPVDPTELRNAVDKAILRLGRKKKYNQLEYILDLLDKKLTTHPRRIALPSIKETRLVELDDMIRCESSNNYTIFHLLSGEEIVVSKPIFEYEDLLADMHFIRCHQSHLVNKRHVVSFLKSEGGYLLLKDGTRVPVSKRRKDFVLQQLQV